jgi:hypothetical protein
MADARSWLRSGRLPPLNILDSENDCFVRGTGEPADF